MNQAIVTEVLRREPTIDFQTAATAELHGLGDWEVLELTAQHGLTALPRFLSKIEYASNIDSAGTHIQCVTNKGY